MSSHVLEPQKSQPSRAANFERLIVTRRDSTGSYSPLGYLEQCDGGYEFVYLRSAAATPGFIPLAGFSNLSRRYRAPYLFPLFAERVMSPRRPDRSRWLRMLDLEPDADAMEVLARSSGRRHGDTLELLRVPTIDSDGQLHAGFLVHGIRHMDPDPSREIAGLERGEDLFLNVESNNAHNPCAVGIFSRRGTKLGYVPDPLTGLIAELCEFTSPRVRVHVANGPDIVPHLRLLVTLTASVPAHYRPLGGPEWEPADSLTDDVLQVPQEST